MYKSLACTSTAEDEESLNCADRTMLLALKKVEFELYFNSCLNVCVLDGIWLTVFGGTEDHPGFTLQESVRTFDNSGDFWEKVINETTYSSWTKVYTEFKYRMVFLEKFYKANGFNRRRICVGF